MILTVYDFEADATNGAYPTVKKCNRGNGTGHQLLAYTIQANTPMFTASFLRSEFSTPGLDHQPEVATLPEEQPYNRRVAMQSVPFLSVRARKLTCESSHDLGDDVVQILVLWSLVLQFAYTYLVQSLVLLRQLKNEGKT